MKITEYVDARPNHFMILDMIESGPISKRVSSLTSYFYDVQRVGKRR